MNGSEWEVFVSRYYKLIYTFCFHYTGRHEDAEDITQDVFVKAFTAKQEVRDPGRERAWIYSIARNCCADRYRSFKRFLTFLTGLDREDRFSEGQEMVALRRMIAALPRRQKEVFILRHWHGFDTAETAKLLGIGEGTVKSHLKRAVDSLRGEFLSEGADDEEG